MKTFRYLLLLALLILSPCISMAQSNGVASDGAVIEQSPYVFPTYDQLPDWTKLIYTKESYETFRSSSTLELVRIKYTSDGLKVVGFIYKPKMTEGKKLPLIIFNRGGVGEEAKIGNSNFHNIYEMYRYASEGFVVIASQYRGIDGGEGKDEMGGSDLNDVMNLVPLAKSLGYVDTNRMFIWGASRGAQMALQAVKQGLPVKAAVVVGAPTDWNIALSQSPSLIRFVKDMWPDFESRKEEHIKSRSAALWADQINVPLLILQGGADARFATPQILAFAQKLDALGKIYELVVYAKDDHPVSLNREDRLRKTIDWFKNPRTIPVSRVIGRTIADQGVGAAAKHYRELKESQPDKYDFSEGELNNLGYELLGAGRVKEAVEIFKLNVVAYPASPNVYDSLGEAYGVAGERELAVKNYKKSLELNPQSTSAVEALRRLDQK